MGATVISEAVETKTATIAISTSLSGAVDLGGRKLVAIVMPSGWDAAGLTFQASPDGVTYYNVYDGATERGLTVAASYYSALAIGDWVGIRWLKIRSGTAGSAVNQTAERTLTLVIQP
jgi:effector-binding domain-containing protein